jgi:hypothetical protein
MASLKNTNINDTGFLKLPVGTTAQRPGTPLTGHVRFNTTTGLGEYYNGSTWLSFASTSANLFSVDYLVIAGGGGGGTGGRSGGGGAGGYRTNLAGSTSGNNTSPEVALSLSTGVSYALTIGSGGPVGTIGGTSTFNTISSTGGGFGGGSTLNGGNGGSGGGGGNHIPGNTTTGGTGVSNQGTAGGTGVKGYMYAGGGGGASQVGNNVALGGNGLSSSITGTAIVRGGGGGGGASGFSTTGGSGGGGAGAQSSGDPTPGTANTGGGGGGRFDGAGNTGLGGSGVIILRIPDTRTATFSAGVTQTNVTSGGFKTYTITAAGISDTVTFS